MSDEVVPIVKRQRGIQSLETGGSILRAMCQTKGSMKLKDIADHVGISAAQLHPYLVSLRTIGLVDQTDTGHYELGPFALELGLARLLALDPYQVTIRYLPEVVDELGCLVAVSVWGDQGPTIVYMREGVRQIHAMVRLGSTFAMNLSATGRVFAAYASSPHVEQFARAAWKQQKPNVAAQGLDDNWLESKLDAIRAQGFDSALGFPVPGVNAVAVPIFDYQGTMQFCVTAMGPAYAFDSSSNGPVVPYLVDVATKISAELGYSPPERAK